MYGQTHTMCGSKSEPEVIPCVVHDLFQILEQVMILCPLLFNFHVFLQ